MIVFGHRCGKVVRVFSMNECAMGVCGVISVSEGDIMSVTPSPLPWISTPSPQQNVENVALTSAASIILFI